MANEFIARKGLIVLANGAVITGSIKADYVSASLFSGSGASLSNLPFAQLTGVPTLVSSSTQINNTVSSSYALTASYAANVPSLVTSASYAVTASAASSLTFIPVTASYALNAGATGGGLTGAGIAQKVAVWSGAGTLGVGSLMDLGAGISVTSSSPITASAFSGNGAAITGIISASYGTNAANANTATSASWASNGNYATLINTPVGIVTSSAQVSYTGLSNLPVGIASSSAQVVALVAGQAIAPTTVNGVNVLSLASTGSQTYTGVQTFQNIVVIGSASVVNVSSSQLLIGESKIIMNTSGPVRFGGMSIYDSGSVNQRSGSFYWDSLRDTFVVEQVGGAGGIASSSLVIFGPRATTGLGNEVGLTANKLPKATADDVGQHITDSQITDDGTNVVVPNNFGVSGSLNVNASIYTYGTAAVNIGTFVVATVPTTYDGAVFTYVVKNVTGTRAGQVYAAWSASVVEFTDTSTNDFAGGPTSDVSFTVDILSNTARLKATAASNSWTVKAIAQAL